MLSSKEKIYARMETYMYFFIFVAALFCAVAVYELINLIRVLLNGRQPKVITFAVVDDGIDLPISHRRTTLEAVLLAVLPQRFDPNIADTTDIMALLRRSGYYYANPGEFFAAAIRDFSQYFLVGVGLSVALVILGMPIAAVPVLAVYIVLGLRRPYTRLKKIAKRRDDAMKNNMLLGLSVLESLLSVSTSAQDAFTQTAQIGGPFCNLLALLSAQISKLPPEDAVLVVKAHLPNSRDVEANLFFNDVRAYFKESRPILSGVKALRHSVHRLVLDATEERAALVRQRANLFGIFAIVGLLFALILPYMGLSF
jgi:hypothetical protein